MSRKRGKYAFSAAAASALLAVSMGIQPAMAKQAGFQGTITMYAGAYGPPFTQLSSAITGPQATVLASLAKEYEKLHPGITIKFVPSPPAGQAYNTWVMTKAAGGQLPPVRQTGGEPPSSIVLCAELLHIARSCAHKTVPW